MISERKNICLVTDSEQATQDLGREISSLLKNRDFISCTGPLGAGKTCFIKGLAAGLGVDQDIVKSPSYVLVYEYQGDLPIFHFDLYRLKNPNELYGLGWDEYLLRDGLMVVEWGEKAGRLLPDKRIDIDFQIVSEIKRKIDICFLD